jgi:hypothetical protein
VEVDENSGRQGIDLKGKNRSETAAFFGRLDHCEIVLPVIIFEHPFYKGIRK